ncbi:hypothetical protein F0562_025741 [Nyssa sinensis]|uniref:Uncharacterized protein n=1 Tax=Nyssa sinensis TaxID=561372 RepID=A0A5J5B8N0_9ASTE|nr:hypothetical protein F0562_025741 [Nyssa sinensis]
MTLPATIVIAAARPDAVVMGIVGDEDKLRKRVRKQRRLRSYTALKYYWKFCLLEELQLGAAGDFLDFPLGVPLWNNRVENSTGVMAYEDNAKRIDWQDQASNVKESESVHINDLPTTSKDKMITRYARRYFVKGIGKLVEILTKLNKLAGSAPNEEIELMRK